MDCQLLIRLALCKMQYFAVHLIIDNLYYSLYFILFTIIIILALLFTLHHLALPPLTHTLILFCPSGHHSDSKLHWFFCHISYECLTWFT